MRQTQAQHAARSRNARSATRHYAYLAGWINQRRGAVVAWTVIGFFLLPIWAFRYIPTADGPSHVYNAVILKDYGKPGTRYHEVFEIQRRQVPNLTSHVLLAALLHATGPLVAEKLLVSCYVVGFVLGFRYFLRSLGPEFDAWTPLAGLFLFNRCLFQGFYNYCLSLVLLWLVLGYCLRRRETFSATSAALLGVLLLLAYFTHLVGYVLAAGGAVWLAAAVGSKRKRRLLWTLAALLPSLLFAADYLWHTRFLRSSDVGATVIDALQTGLWQNPLSLWHRMLNVDVQLFGPYDGINGPVAFASLVLLEAVVVSSLHGRLHRARQGTDEPLPPGPRLAIAVLGIAIAAFFLLLPDHLGRHGGFLRCRFVVLPPLLWMACLRPHPRPVFRRATLVGVGVVLALGLWTVARYFSEANRDIARFTACLGSMGRRCVFAVEYHGRRRIFADYLENAADYLCLGTGNVNVSNYEAVMPHFPITYRRGHELAYERPVEYAAGRKVTLLLWNPLREEERTAQQNGFRETARYGQLQVFQPRVKTSDFE